MNLSFIASAAMLASRGSSLSGAFLSYTKGLRRPPSRSRERPLDSYFKKVQPHLIYVYNKAKGETERIVCHFKALDCLLVRISSRTVYCVITKIVLYFEFYYCEFWYL